MKTQAQINSKIRGLTGESMYDTLWKDALKWVLED